MISQTMKLIWTYLVFLLMVYGHIEITTVAANTVEHRSFDDTKEIRVVSTNEIKESGTPMTPISFIKDSVKPVNQNKDSKDILRVITPDTRGDVGSVSGKSETTVSTISISNSAKQVNQSINISESFPVIINDIGNVGDAKGVSENRTSASDTSNVHTGNEHVNQSINTSGIVPVVTNNIRSDAGNAVSVNESTGNGSQVAAVSVIDTVGPVNQRKDTSDIVPVMTSNTRFLTRNSTGADNSSPVAVISVINSIEPVNQSKDTSEILPVVTNVTEIGDTVNVNQRNGQEPVSQAKDLKTIMPVETNVTNLNEVDADKEWTKPVNITVPPPIVVIDDQMQPISDVPFVDLNVRFNSIGTEFCLNKSRCNSTISSKTCSCDRLCGILEDCCEDADNVRDSNLHLNQFACTYVAGLSEYGEGLMFVSKCPPLWSDGVTKKLCEQANVTDDIFSRLPVSAQSEAGIIYKNKHCAHCNNVFKYEFWRASMKCLADNGDINITDTKNCELFYKMPNEFSPFRKCKINFNIMSTCPPSYTDDETRENCANGIYSLVHSGSGKKYRNKYCAICNGVNVRNLYCEPLFSSVRKESFRPPRVYSFRLIVDFNSKWEAQNEQFRKPFIECDNNEIYDPFSKLCRKIFCPPSTIPLQGKCIPNLKVENIKEKSKNETLFESADNCTLTIINQSEYKYLKDTNTIIIRDTVFNETEYWKNGSDVLVCLEKLNIISRGMTSKRTTLYSFNKVESYTSLVGLIVSITASLFTLSVYILFPQLLNTPGKNVICLIISLTLAQLLFLVAAEVDQIQAACSTFAILMHYFFLCAFCWMNVIAFDLWITFSNKFVSQRHQVARSKRFYFYSLYAWCLPLLIVGVAIIFNYASFDGADVESFRPNYGQTVCWITSRNALLLFFAGPLAIFKLFDFVSFGFTAYHITKAKRQCAFARKGPSTSAFLINLRLSLVMGLTWAFAFVANFTNNTIMWYFFIIFNTLQGLLIALSFLCTRKVLKLFREKYEKYSSQTSGTQMTTRPSYKLSE